MQLECGVNSITFGWSGSVLLSPGFAVSSLSGLGLDAGSGQGEWEGDRAKAKLLCNLLLKQSGAQNCKSLFTFPTLSRPILGIGHPLPFSFSTPMAKIFGSCFVLSHSATQAPGQTGSLVLFCKLSALPATLSAQDLFGTSLQMFLPVHLVGWGWMTLSKVGVE